MKTFPRHNWPWVALASIICAYLFITSGIGGILLANFPGPDRTSYPGVVGNTIAFVLGGLILSLIRLSYPLALHAGQFEHGTYALVQLPLVLGSVVVAAAVTTSFRKKRRTIVMSGVVAYLLMMLATNDLSFVFRVDHSNDFPIGRALNKLDWRDKPTEADVRRVAGPPLAVGIFSSSNSTLPAAVRENMIHWKRDMAFILAYYEEDKWDRRTTYYVMCDPDTRERFSQVGIHRQISNELWPNHGLESTSAPPAAGTLETHP